MANEIFAMTPIEASMWHWAVSAQSYLATELFGSNVFLGVVVLALTCYILKSFWGLTRGQQAEEEGRRIVVRLVMLGLGLLFLRVMNTSPFLPVDSSGTSWQSKSFVVSNQRFANLRNSTDGLYWYTFIHKGGVQLGNFLTNTVNGIFQDPSYPRSPNMLFKVFVGTATVALDDSRVTQSLDVLAQTCSDTANGKVVGRSDSLKILFDLSSPECQQKYRELELSLSRWASRKMPAYVRKFNNLGPGEFPQRLARIKDRATLENKIIASAVLNYAKSKRSNKDGINTNTEALAIQSVSEHFWFTVQRMVSGGSMVPAIVSQFTEEDVEAGIVKNEAGIIYNNLLNLVPPIKGYIKAFICFSFLMVAALLSLGFVKPSIWWLNLLLMEAMYTPLSALNYQLCSFFLTSADVMASFGDLAGDPLVLAGASVIDSQLVRVQTAYFLVQTVICAMFVYGVIRAGFTVRQMSFAHGRGYMSAASSFLNNRFIAVGSGVLSRSAGRFVRSGYRKWRGIDV